ncbi:Peptidyl-prolyl cis-trans isomerase [Quillaja saponaria]|uniref:Peptidyl-prolyl cis-trans isomerase n=1 Tax=Quillaja saponaria TaxID=32244 RepID=A0AAD7LFY9_QUISA|nr:Peptidyl-prolyl cis-trans isomerase [Quillaja saponaria]
MGYSVISSPPYFISHHHPRHSPPQLPSFSPNPNPKFVFSRRSLLLLSTSTSLSIPFSPSSAATAPPSPDTTITDRVFMDFSICPNYYLPERTISDDVASLCSDSVPLGRLVLGLYGHLVPITVSNFKSMCTGSSGSSYKNTLVNKIFPGQYFLAGRQGRRDKGEVRVSSELARNTETIDSKAFLLTHSRAGVLSLSLSENDDDDGIKLDPNYRNVEFLITTGPGPCPQLDNKNVVFGVVLEGLDVVTAIASIPTYQPAERIRQFNDLAEFLGDERAQNARAIWNKPLKTIYISDCGELKVAKPSLSPSLP